MTRSKTVKKVKETGSKQDPIVVDVDEQLIEEVVLQMQAYGKY